MGITKRPTSSCNDEIIPVDIEELVDNIVYTSHSSEHSSSDSESEYEMIMPSIHLIDSVEFYRSFYPELINLPDGVNNNNTEADNKSVAYKKKSFSQMGRRKANRAQNESFLLSLSGDQQHPEDEIFYNDNKNGFTKAIHRLYSEDLKELFIDGKDELVLQKNNKQNTTKINDKKSKRNTRPDMAFKNLTMSQKSFFKQKSLPIIAINHLETEIVNFFSRLPNGVYTSVPLSNYHRMVLHSIARYYSLDATSVNSRGKRTQKIVQVTNSRFNDFLPPRITLLKFVSNPNH